MGKVISIFTGKEISAMPTDSIEYGEALIEELIRYEGKSPSNLMGGSELIHNLISMVENNTGARRMDVIDKVFEKEWGTR